MGKGSTSRSVGLDYARAEAERTRRDSANGLQFPSVWHALAFMHHRGDAMQGALGRHPRGETAIDGTTVVLSVDGGRGGSIDDVLATLQTIANALADLRVESPDAFDAIMAYSRNWAPSETGGRGSSGKSYAEIGKTGRLGGQNGGKGVAPSTVGALIGKAEFFLLGRLRGSVIIGGRS